MWPSCTALQVIWWKTEAENCYFKKRFSCLFYWCANNWTDVCINAFGHWKWKPSLPPGGEINQFKYSVNNKFVGVFLIFDENLFLKKERFSFFNSVCIRKKKVMKMIKKKKNMIKLTETDQTWAIICFFCSYSRIFFKFMTLIPVKKV